MIQYLIESLSNLAVGMDCVLQNSTGFSFINKAKLITKDMIGYPLPTITFSNAETKIDLIYKYLDIPRKDTLGAYLTNDIHNELSKLPQAKHLADTIVDYRLYKEYMLCENKTSDHYFALIAATDANAGTMIAEICKGYSEEDLKEVWRTHVQGHSKLLTDGRAHSQLMELVVLVDLLKDK